MYTEHFGLNEKPFSISPDPRYLYLSQRHADALAHLLYGISESGGFIQLTGEVGTGKTTLIRTLLGQLPDRTEIALILNPQVSTKQFLQSICLELRVPFVQRDTGKTLIDRLNARLLELHAENRRVVMIVDEAQTMSPELLEQVRLLTNLETEKQKLLQIILIGQPELRSILARSDMRQVAQRITGRYHLEPLTGRDTATYVAHRLKVAGGRMGIFSKHAVARLYRLSGGIPRLINIIADRALLAAYARDESRIGPGLVGKAANEVFGRTRALRWWPWAASAALALLLFGYTSRDAPNQAVELAPADSMAATLRSDETPLPEAAGSGPRTGATEAPDAPAPFAGPPPAAGDGEPPAVSLESLLAARSTDAGEALDFLFGLWSLEVDSAGSADPCALAAAKTIRCVALEGSSIGELRALNRPVLLELHADGGSRHHVVLLGLDETHAIVWIAGTPERIAISDLSLFTFGQQLVLFRPAIAETSGALSEGARGLGVIWLRTCLASLAGDEIASTEPELFDASLTAAVKAYQRTRGLDADGVVGDRTLLRLQSDIGLVDLPLKPGTP